MRTHLDCNGSAIIEFALIFPILAIISILSFDLGMYLLDRQNASIIVASQVSEVTNKSNPLDIKANIEGILETQSFYRVRPNGPVNVNSICLCGNENLTSLSEVNEFFCSEPPRCEITTKSYVVISVDFLLDTSSLLVSQGTFLPPFTETVVVRTN